MVSEKTVYFIAHVYLAEQKQMSCNSNDLHIQSCVSLKLLTTSGMLPSGTNHVTIIGMGVNSSLV